MDEVTGMVGAMPVDQMDPEPLYRQLAAELRGKIERGEYQPGQLLPSEAHLQQEYQLGRSTVRSALALLRDEGLVVTITARGTFVARR